MSRENQDLHDTLFRLLVSIATLLAVSMAVAAQEDESKNASPRTGAISGRVVNENGQPIPHAAIFVSAPMDPMQSRMSATDDRGNFQVSGLDALIYTLSASAPTYVITPRDPEALPSYYRIGDSVTISLIKGGVITGTVTSPTGEPLVQAGVRAILIRDANGKAPSPGRFAIDRPTDDRGVYRIYGLPAGTYLVSAGGRGTYGFSNNPYDTDAPTYAPSSARDTAAEVIVRAGGEETTVDIRYRGEPGHAVSGVVSGPIAPNSSANITLAQIVDGHLPAGWKGSLVPATVAALVQAHADRQHPLQAGLARKLLQVLDALVDLGDRRSAALQQSESFRGVRLATPA